MSVLGADPKLVVSSSGQKEEECPEGLDSRLGDRAVARSDSTPIDTQQPNPGDEKDPQEENSEDALEEIQNDWGALEKGNKDGDQQEIQEIQERDYKRGEKSSIKDLYKTSKSACPCCITWDDEKPYKEDAEKAAKAKSEREKYAIVHKQEAHGGESGWKTFAIDINSPILKDRLTTAFADYPAADMSALDISFLPPFLPFVHRWTALVEVEEKEKENIALKHLALLRQIVEPELENAMRAMKHLNYSGYITFEDIVFAFIPGDVLVKSTSKSMSAGILRKVTKNEFHGKKYYTLEINVVDWNGFTTGVRTATWFLDEFSGSCKLTQLDIFPLTRHSQQKSIRERLLEQGARFEQLRGQHFKTYNGHATYKRTFDHLLYGTQEREARKPISERVIVDAYGYYELQRKSFLNVRPLTSLRDIAATDFSDYDGYDDTRGVSSSPPLVSLEPLTAEQRLFVVSQVKGFAVQRKEWCELNVMDIQEISWREDAFQRLVLPQNEKDVLLAFISRPDQDEDFIDDVIPEKGKGIIVLLCGPPGVGKTLTAESVAEQLKRPLYRLSAGDLGTSATSVDKSLQDALDCCAHFNAVLLIDEADVFLETRSINSLERNELVSIFLRLLEYYNGVLILTTNRSSNIDEAFESRIDVTLAYSDLGEVDREKIWENLLRTRTADVKSEEEEEEYCRLGEVDIKKLAKRQLNGRQIKSAVKTAHLLAAHKREPLALEHLEVVLQIREKARQVIGDKRAEYIRTGSSDSGNSPKTKVMYEVS